MMNKEIPLFSLKRRLVSGGAWVFSSRVLTAILGLIANALLARLLSPEELGAYFLVLSIVLFASVFASCGMKQVVVRLVAEALARNLPGRARFVVRYVFSYCALGVLIMVIAYGAGLGEWLSENIFHSSLIKGVTGLTIILIVVTVFRDIAAETFRGLHDIRLASIFGGLVTGLIAVLFFAAVRVARHTTNFDTALELFTIASVVSAILAILFLRRKIRTLGQEGKATPKDVFTVAWPLFFSTIAFFVLSEAHIWILGAYQPQSDVAIYGAVYRLVNLIAMPLLIVNNVIPPLVSELHTKGDTRRLERVLRASATVSGAPALTAFLLLVLFGQQILDLVYGEFYQQGFWVLLVLACGQLVNVLTGSPGVLLMMAGKEKHMLVIAILSGVSGIVTSLLLVQSISYLGVATGVAVGVTLQNMTMWFFCRRYLRISTHMSIKDTRLLYGDLRAILTSFKT